MNGFNVDLAALRQIAKRAPGMSNSLPEGCSGYRTHSTAVNDRGVTSLVGAASGSAVNSDRRGSLNEELRRATAWTGAAADAAGHAAEPIHRQLDELQSTCA